MKDLKSCEHSSAEEQLVYTQSVGGSNPSARTIINFFKSTDNYKDKIELALRTTVARVLDLFGKTSLDDLSKTQKTILGSVFEDKIRRLFNLEDGDLDFKIDEVDTDLKFSIRNSWMIPPECVNKFCILASLDFDGGSAFGVFHARDEYLHNGGNRDKKRGISKKHFNKIEWIFRQKKGL